MQVQAARNVGTGAMVDAASRASVTQLQPVLQGSPGVVRVLLAPAPIGNGFSFELPERTAQTLRQVEGSVTALRIDGSPLPDWLLFDAERWTFSAAAVPPGGLPIEVLLSVGGLRLTVEIRR